MARGRNAVIYEDRRGDPYYEEDLREDNKGLYIYDEYEREKVYFEEPERERGRGRNSRDRNSRDRPRERSASYSIDEEESAYDIKASIKSGNVKEKTLIKDKDYTELEKINSFKTHTKKTDLYNGLVWAKSLGEGVKLTLTYPKDNDIDNDTVDSVIKYIKTLMLKPDALYKGPKINSEVDLLLSRLCNLSFKDIKMIELLNNLPLLMEQKGQTDKGWNVLIERLELLKTNQVNTNVFVIPESFVTPIMSLLSGTNTFRMEVELKDKLNLGYSGFIVIDNIVLKVDYLELQLFMVI